MGFKMSKLGFFLQLWLLLTLIAAAGCFSQPSEDSSEVDQDRIHVGYRVSYDGDTNQTTVAARFRFGNTFGTPLRLDTPASIHFNDDSMTYHEFLDEYQRDYKGVPSDGAFHYIDNANHHYDNTVIWPKRIELPTNITILRNQDHVLSFGPDALIAGEQAEVSIESQVEPGKSAFASEYHVGKNTITLQKYQLEQLPQGAATLKVKRTLSSPAEHQSGAGSDMDVIYQHATITVTIN